MQPLITVKNLEVSFKTHCGSIQAVRGISFSMQSGETVALVGESGSGKSVTAKSILKLIPTPPGRIIGGEIYFQGKNLLASSEKELRKIRGKEVGMIFQDPMTSLNPTMRIGKQIIEVLTLHSGLGHKEAHAYAVELLRKVGIAEPEERIFQYPHQFSGGMRQRVMIAIALACKPKLLIADEPTTALDVTVQAQILELMKSLQKEMGMSILLITHDLRIVAKTCDRMIVLYGGKIVEEGPVTSIFRNPLHPYTQALLHSLPKLDNDKNDRLISIAGSPPDLQHPPSACPFWPRCPHAMRICPEVTPALQEIEKDRFSACWLHHKKEGGTLSHAL